MCTVAGLSTTIWLPNYSSHILSHTHPSSPPPYAATAPYPYNLLCPPHLTALLLFVLIHIQHFSSSSSHSSSSSTPSATSTSSRKLISLLGAVALLLSTLVMLRAPGLGVPSWPGTIWRDFATAATSSNASTSDGGDIESCDTVYQSSLKHTQPSAWCSLYMDLHLCLFLILPGLIGLMSISAPSDTWRTNTLVCLYAVCSLYLAALMRGFSSLLAPAASLASAQALCALLRPYLLHLRRAISLPGTQFTRFTSTKVQILTQEVGVSSSRQAV